MNTAILGEHTFCLEGSSFLSYCCFESATVEQIVTQCVLSLRESILKTAKALVEDTKLLVAGAASSQDKLAQAAHSSAKTITQLTEVVKLGATSMGSEGPETQVIKIQFPLSVRMPHMTTGVSARRQSL